VGAGCRCWYTGVVKREGEAVYGVDEDTNNDAGAARGASGDARVARARASGPCGRGCQGRTWRRHGH
jgi:hypothetical protein